jgi:hypothetical protein
VKTLGADPAVLYYVDGLTKLARGQAAILSSASKFAGWFVWAIGATLALVGLGFWFENRMK